MADMHNEGVPGERFDDPPVPGRPNDGTADAGEDVDMHNELWSGLLSLLRRFLRLGR